MSRNSKRLRPGDKGYSRRSFGEDRTTHSRLVIKVPPPELIELRKELTLHKDIYDYAIQGNTFEECCGKIAEKLDILLDGLYDGDKLCGLLLEALRNRRFHGNQPHLRAKDLVNVELIERQGTITIEEVKEGTIAPTPVLEEELILHHTVREGGDWLNWPPFADDNRVSTMEPEIKIATYAPYTTLAIIHRVVLHSFRTNKGREWDAVNTWRKPRAQFVVTEHSSQEPQSSSSGSESPAEVSRPSLSESVDSEDSSGYDKAGSQLKH